MSDKLCVLVCDDEPQILRALRVILREAGFEVLPADSAQAALDSAALKPPSAAIIDLVLPDGDGVEVCRSLRAWSDMPIVVLSAVDEEAEKVRALNAGADDYVTKPFGPSELLARLQRRASPSHICWRCRASFGRRWARAGSRRARGSPRRPRAASDADGVRAPPGTDAKPRAADDARGAAHRGLGPGLRERHTDAARPCGQPASQDRARPERPPLLRGEGDPLVLVPGGLTGWLSWVPHAERLSERLKTIRVQPIHNELGSAGQPGDPDYTAEVERESLRLTLEELGVEAADFCGWSGGARALIEFALAYPETVRTLTLVEPAAYWILEQLGEAHAEVERVNRFMHGLAGREVSEGDLAEFLRMAGFIGPQTIRASTRTGRDGYPTGCRSRGSRRRSTARGVHWRS